MAERDNTLLSRAVALAPAAWRTNTLLWVDAFAIVNLSFLSLDIYLAHSANSFLRREEYIPLGFSLVAPVLLLVAVLAREWWNRDSVWMFAGHLVGATSILIGLSGVIYHLDSQFFYVRTLRSLTYAAPFAAPLAYAGIGMLLIMNRMVDPASREWSQWVVLLTLGGFVGNFVLSLTDHATNGFFNLAEWIPVISAAVATAFLGVAVATEVDTRYMRICAWVLVVQALVGALGFVLHIVADMHGPSLSLIDNVINGAPPFAPLLFPNLSLLGWIGLWTMSRHTQDA